jgi:polar amino acid transport system substrate-binding protein
MKKVIIILIALIALGGCKKNTNELIMVTEAGFAPYEYYDGGEVVGVDVDIAKEIAKYLGKTLVVKDIAFDSIINEVKTGKADFGAAGISYSEDRAKNVDFSINYSVSKQVVIVSNNSNINNVNSISNKKIAVQLGSIADAYVTDNFKNASIVINNALQKAERIESEAESLRRKVSVYKRRFRTLVEDQLDEMEQFDDRP